MYTLELVLFSCTHTVLSSRKCVVWAVLVSC